jgi:hypothetical protein
MDFFFLTNSINFAFTDFETGIKFASEYKGVPWSGAMGMAACLKKAFDEKIPILDGRFLENISKE